MNTIKYNGKEFRALDNQISFGPFMFDFKKLFGEELPECVMIYEILTYDNNSYIIDASPDRPDFIFEIIDKKLYLTDYQMVEPLRFDHNILKCCDGDMTFCGYDIKADQNSYYGYENMRILTRNFPKTYIFRVTEDALNTPVRGHFDNRKLEAFLISSDENGTVEIVDYSDFFSWKAIFWPKAEPFSYQQMFFDSLFWRLDAQVDFNKP